MLIIRLAATCTTTDTAFNFLADRLIYKKIYIFAFPGNCHSTSASQYLSRVSQCLKGSPRVARWIESFNLHDRSHFDAFES